MTETPSTAAARPEPKLLTASAAAYFSELGVAARLVQHHYQEAVLVERGHWLAVPHQHTEATRGPGAALNSPAIHVDNYRYGRLYEEVGAARLDVARVAWWYASAALAGLDAVLAGKEISARRLEVLTLQAPGRDEAVKGELRAWAPCFRPHLPGEGELRTGVQELDESMDHALAPLREAYAAAVAVEEIDAAEDELAAQDDDLPEHMTGREAAELAQAEAKAVEIPGLLIAYAEVLVTVAHRAPRTMSA